ncbi:hypothetical protein OAB93_00460 [bacterium]|nr:hypothetical protein [bacterium]
MIKKRVLVDKQQGSMRLYASENPCAKCPSGCTSAATPPAGLQIIDFAWPSAHLNAVALYLFGLPLLLLVTAVWFMDSYAVQLATTSEMSLGRFTMASIPIVVLAASMGMVLGGRLARKKSRSLIQALKEAIAIPTISTSERASSENSL